MSLRVIADVLELELDNPTAKLVMLTMAFHANDDGGSAYPSVARLAQKCNLDRRTVQRTLQWLIGHGWLAVERTASRHDSTSYKVNVRGGTAPPGGGAPQRQRIPLGAAFRPSRGGTAPPELSGTVLKGPNTKTKRCPEGFDYTQERSEYALVKGLGIEEAAGEFESFLDHEYRYARSDWDACWRTWVRNAIKFRGRAGGKTRATRDETTKGTIAKLREMGDDDGPEMADGGVGGRADQLALPRRLG